MPNDENTLLHDRVLDALLDRRFDEPTMFDLMHEQRWVSYARDGRRRHWFFQHATREGPHWIWRAKRSADGYPLVWLPRRELMEVLPYEDEGYASVEHTVDPARYVSLRKLIGFRLLARLMELDWDWYTFNRDKRRERFNFYTDLGAFPFGYPGQLQELRPENWWMNNVRFTMKCGVQTCIRPTHVRLEPRDVHDIADLWDDDPTTKVRFFHPYLQQRREAE